MTELTEVLDAPSTLEERSEETGEIIYQKQPTEITVREDRHRQKMSRKSLDTLITSIRETGQTQPGVCRFNEAEELELLIGERRLRACMMLQIPFKYYIKEEVSNPLLLEQIQLDENLCREDLDWRDEIKAKARLHAILTEMHGEAQSGMVGGHTLLMTAEHIGVKKSILQEDVTLAGFLEIPEIEAAPNKTTAKKVAKRMIEQVKRQEMLSSALAVAKEGQGPEAPLTEQARADQRAVQRALAAQQKAKIESGEAEPEKEKSALEQQLIYYNRRCILGKMEDKLLNFEDESFDIICFDPPWGVEFDKVRKNSAGTKGYEDTEYFFREKLYEWLALIYEKMKLNSHLYMFFGITKHQFVYDTLEGTGFGINRMPLIWHKKGSHVTRNPLIWPGRSYEPIAYARKGSKPLAKQGASDVIETPMPTPSMKDIHPSAKHPQIYKELLLRSAQPSDTILDPMAGSGMFGVAAESLAKTHALNWFQIEVDLDYRNLQLLNLTKGYDQICSKKDEPYRGLDYEPPSLAEDFKTLRPGTPEWTQYWQAYPEQQDQMLEWRKTKA